MTDKLHLPEPRPQDRWESATEAELSMALARLQSAVETAREAGRPITARALLGEARDVRAQWRRLAVAANASRGRVANQTADLVDRDPGRSGPERPDRGT